MAFKNIQFPINIAKNSFGGPCFMTNITQITSGREFANQIWRYPKVKYTISSGLLSQTEIQEILSFFRIMNGKLHSFRFKDWSDFETKNEKITIYQSSEKKFQLIKNYKMDNETCIRNIILPIDNSLTIFVNNNPLDREFFRLLDDGIVEILSNLSQGDEISASFEFDIKMRFDVDFIAISPQTTKSYKMQDMVLTEVI